jgi:predicted RNA binding protein YcfA (HicA-like mRNA interferase family)
VPRIETPGFWISPAVDSHCHYEKNGLHPCVPMHRQIKPKTLQSILKHTNIAIEELKKSGMPEWHNNGALRYRP